MDVLRQLIEDARAVMGDMSTTQRVSVATLVATVAALLVFAVYMGSREVAEGAVPLPLAVEPSEAKDVVERLNSAGLGPAEFRADMRIWVPLEKSKDAWVFLAQENLLPPDAAAGFLEMLKEWSFSTTRHQSEQMMRVALNHEVARLIERIKMVKTAHVIYSGPGRDRLFKQSLNKRAAVTVTTTLGQRLTREVANTIINMVAAAQAGLDRQAIMITDQDGRHFRAEDPEEVGTWSAREIEVEGIRKRKLREEIEALCRQVVPDCEAWAFVDVDMDFTKEQTYEKVFSEGPPLRQIQEKESREATSEPAAEVGTRPNVARAQTLERAGQKEFSKEGRKETDRTLQNSWKETWQKKPPTIQAKTISAVVQMPYVYQRGVKQEDGTYKVTPTTEDGTPAPYIPEEDQYGNVVEDENGDPILKRFSVPVDELMNEEKQTELKRLIAKAAGIPLENIPETIELIGVPYPERREFVEAPPGATAKLFEQFRQNVVPILMLGVLFAGLLFIYLQARRALPAEEVELPEDRTVAMEMAPEPVSEADQEQANFEAMQAKIADAVAEDPAKAATLIRRWMTTE